MKRLILTVRICRGCQIAHFSSKRSSSLDGLQKSLSRLFRDFFGSEKFAHDFHPNNNAPQMLASSAPFDVGKFLHRNDEKKYEFLGIDLMKDWPSPEPSNVSKTFGGISTNVQEHKVKKSHQDGYDLMQVWEDDNLETKSSINKVHSKDPTRQLSHIDEKGEAKMVDIGQKLATRRTASAEATVTVTNEIMLLLLENRIKKGDVLTVAQVAGIFGAKKTAELIPLCHNIQLSDVQVQLRLDQEQCKIIIRSDVRCDAKTGAEMEALTAVSVAALTVYDMCKALSKNLVISDIRLLTKTGGKSDFQAADDHHMPFFFEC